MRVEDDRLEKPIGMSEGKWTRLTRRHVRWMDDTRGTTKLTADELREVIRDRIGW